MFTYHIATNTWTNNAADALPNALKGTRAHAMGEGDKYYLLGGSDANGDNDKLLVYDPSRPSGPSPWVLLDTLTRGCASYIIEYQVKFFTKQ